MPTSIQSPTPASSILDQPRRRQLPYDRLVILLIGTCACVLSFDSLRQVALATHVRPDLSYLFPVVIDGFIAYGVRAMLLLRDAPRSARLYAGTLFSAATAASLWANSLHSVRLNTDGTHVLVLGNQAVAVLSTIAPLALGGATHLHILVTRHGHSHQPPESVPAGTSSPNPADSQGIPAAEPAATRAVSKPAAATAHQTVAASTPTSRKSAADKPRSSDRIGVGRPGRRADATIDDLAAVIARAHGHVQSGQITRAAAREAIQASGLSAGNDRIAQALTHLEQARATDPQPPTE